MMGYEHVSGSDVSEKAIKDTQNNLSWFTKNYQLLANSYQLFKGDVRELSKHLHEVDAVVTEPYLGPALRGEPHEQEVQATINELTQLYGAAFVEFAKILKPGGRVVMVFPVFRFSGDEYHVSIIEKIKQLEFTPSSDSPQRYSRPDQKVMRDIWVFTRF